MFWSNTQQENMSTIIQKRRWRWIRHVIQIETNAVTKTARRWTPKDKQKQQ
uniref:Uncharacterized protein n=1 Tax=Arion vulgaris TaxID=1028688 RepID=A0A0B7BPI1_9EUPU